MKRIPWISIVIGLAIATLTGCSSPEHSVVLQPDQVAGEWRTTPGEHEIELVITQDGKFSSSNWPKSLFCTEVPPRSSADIDWNDRISVSGTWRIANDGQGTIRRMSSSSECKGSGGSLHPMQVNSKLELWLYFAGAADKADYPHISFVALHDRGCSAGLNPPASSRDLAM